jgi:predicted AlkP superfamily pyrophosphatase or phosphodiesterase
MTATTRFGATTTFILLCIGILTGCTAPDKIPPTVILISLDGFRWDYLDRSAAPTLQAIASRGVRADGLIPVFPTKTFPNHYSIVTGLYPEHHGLVANNMYDPSEDSWFSLGDREAVGDSRWYGGEPVWVAAERAGRPTAPLFWPGSEAAIGGVRPTHGRAYDHGVRPRALVDELLVLLDLPPAERPTFLTMYFHETDDVGHGFGTTSPEVDSAIAVVDNALAYLIAGLEARGIRSAVDIIVVSDHGMADTSNDRVIFLDELVDLDQVTVSDWNPVVAIWPDSGAETSTYERLRAHPHLTVYRKDSIPDRLHYRAHARIAPLIGVADEGWSISTRGYVADHPEAFEGAAHGYDPAVPAMKGLFVAAGPSFKRGVRRGPLANVHLYELMCAILGLTPGRNDGSLDSVRSLLRPGVAPGRPAG